MTKDPFWGWGKTGGGAPEFTSGAEEAEPPHDKG